MTLAFDLLSIDGKLFISILGFIFGYKINK